MPEHRITDKECHENYVLISKEQHCIEISSKEAGRVKHNKTTRLPGKDPKKEKTKTYLDKPSLWLKRIILMEHEMFFFLNLNLSYRRY